MFVVSVLTPIPSPQQLRPRLFCVKSICRRGCCNGIIRKEGDIRIVFRSFVFNYFLKEEDRLMKKVLNGIDDYLEEVLLGIALAAMAVIMGVQVFCRYVLGASLSWSEELTRYIFIWAGFLSVSYCTKKCISIKIEQFVALFPKRGKAMFKVVNHTFELILFLYLIPFAWKYLMSAVANGQTSPAMGIPMYFVQAAPLVGFVLSAVRVFQRWVAEFQTVRGKGEK